ANDSSLQLLGENQDEDRRLIAELVVQRMHQFCRPPGTQLPLHPAGPAAVPSGVVSQTGSTVTAGSVSANVAPTAAPLQPPRPIPPSQTSGDSSASPQAVPVPPRPAPPGLRRGSSTTTNPPPPTPPPPSAAALQAAGSSVLSKPTTQQQQQPPPVPPAPGAAPVTCTPGSTTSDSNPFNATAGAAEQASAAASAAASALSRGAASLFRRESQSEKTGVDDPEDTMGNLRKTFAGVFGDM
ncbi:synapsin-like, partial [Tropilaelaps mercedesae]